MKGEAVKSKVIVLGAFIFVLLGAHCKKDQLTSAWRDMDIIIEGDSSEWQEHLFYNKDKNISIGLLNDDEAVYLCLVTRDANLKKQVIGGGLILWLDSEGGKHKTFGIKYPIGLIEKGVPPRKLTRGMREADDQFTDEKMSLYFDQTFTGLQVLTKRGRESNFYTLNEVKAKGLEIKASIKNDVLTYELKVPFNFDAGIASLSLDVAAPLGVGLETPELDRSEMQQKMRADTFGKTGGSRGGMRGRGSGTGGGGRGGMRGRSSGMGGQPVIRPQPVKIWTKVILAEK